MKEKEKFFESKLCKSRARCKECRMSVKYRKSIMKSYDVNDGENFECPYGVKVKDFINIEMPSLLQQAKNLASTAKDVIKDAAKGKKIISEDSQAAERMAICKSCPYLDQESVRCTKCGCNMKYKTKIKSAKCPIGKWDS